MGRRVVVAGTILVLAAGCGLRATGQMVTDGETGPSTPSNDPSGPDGSSVNANADGGLDDGSSIPVSTCETDACALPARDADFGVVLYGDRSAPCPTGFDSVDVVEAPKATAPGCLCGSCSITGVNCNTGTLDTTYGSSNTCANNGVDSNANNGQCDETNTNWSTWGGVIPPAAVGGTCTMGASTVNKANIGSTAVRVCSPQSSTCAAELCAPPPSLKACSIHDGDVTCPVGAPNKHVIGTDVSATCAACGCSSFTAKCTGTLVIYSNSGCTGTAKNVPANMCVQMNSFQGSSSKWTGMLGTTSCVSTPAPEPTLGVVGPKTVCCP